SRCRRESRKTQCGPSLITPCCQSGSDLQHSDPVSRAIVLVDVRGRLLRAKNRERGECSESLFLVRKICRRFARAGTSCAAIQAFRNEECVSSELPRSIDHECCVHPKTCGTFAG